MGNYKKIVKIDVDKNRPFAQNYFVSGVPTMLFFKDGKQVRRESRVLQKDDIVHIIKSHN